MNGSAFGQRPPLVSDTYSQQREREGLPYPVHCCWNGLAVFDAAPLQQGLHFRAHEEGECDASECQLFCNDLKRLGFTQALVDPSVRTAYELEVARMVRSAFICMLCKRVDKTLLDLVICIQLLFATGQRGDTSSQLQHL